MAISGSGHGRTPGTDTTAVSSAAFTFLAFAMPASMFGVFWDDARERFDQSLGTLGLISLVYGLSRMSTSGVGRAATRRFGIGPCFIAGVVAVAVIDLVVAAASSWPMFLVGISGVGLASGLLDSVGAGVVATIGDVGRAGVIHGAYGVGATVGPLIVAVVPDWRWSLVVASVVAVAALVPAVIARASWPEPPPIALASGGALPRRATTVSLLVFAAFVAIEVTMGQWLFTYLTDGRGIGDSVAAVGVSGFWGGTTAGRLALASARTNTFVERVGLPALAVAAGAAYAGVVVSPGAMVVVFATLAGLALSPLVPTMSARTVDRVGEEHAQRISGWQLLAANVGAISVPSLTGALVDGIGPAAVVAVVAACLALGVPVLLAARRLPSLSPAGGVDAAAAPG